MAKSSKKKIEKSRSLLFQGFRLRRRRKRNQGGLRFAALTSSSSFLEVYVFETTYFGRMNFFFVCVKTVVLLTGLLCETNLTTTTTFICKESSSFSGFPFAETKEKTLRWFSFWRANVFVFVLGNLRFRNNLFRTYVVSWA